MLNDLLSVFYLTSFALILPHAVKAIVIEKTFQQLIDHRNPSLGTFSQRYWINTEHYQRGAPVVLYDPGEIDAGVNRFHYVESGEPYKVARALGGMSVVLENRYQGKSLPVKDFTTANMKYLSTDQIIQDTVRFSQLAQFDLPFKTTSSDVPWFLSGVSASGENAVYTRRLYPEVFAAVKGSSATILSLYDFSSYWEASLRYGASNCTHDLRAAIQLLDLRVKHDSDAQWANLLSKFGMTGLEVRSDLPACMIEQLQIFQYIFYVDRPYSDWYAFCDFLQSSSDGSPAPVSGWGAARALDRLAEFKRLDNIKNKIGTPGGMDVEVRFGTHKNNADYMDTSPSSSRALAWMQCTQYAGEQIYSSSLRYPSVFNDQEYYARQCRFMFGDKFFPTQQTSDRYNAKYGGLDNARLSRIFWTVGEWDPWRPTTVDQVRSLIPPTSEYVLLKGESHGTDTFAEDSGPKGSKYCPDIICKDLHSLEIKRFGQWATEWYAKRGIVWKPPPFE